MATDKAILTQAGRDVVLFIAGRVRRRSVRAGLGGERVLLAQRLQEHSLLQQHCLLQVGHVCVHCITAG